MVSDLLVDRDHLGCFSLMVTHDSHGMDSGAVRLRPLLDRCSECGLRLPETIATHRLLPFARA